MSAQTMTLTEAAKALRIDGDNPAHALRKRLQRLAFALNRKAKLAHGQKAAEISIGGGFVAFKLAGRGDWRIRRAKSTRKAKEPVRVKRARAVAP